MDRDNIILDCYDIVDNLVKKYNNYHLDEDMQSEGMIAVVECVDRCLSENMTDMNRIRGRVSIWVRNRILTLIYKEKIKYADDENALDFLEGSDDEYFKYVDELRQELTPKQLEMLNLLLEGKNETEIMKELKIERAMYFRHLQNIKEKIKK